MQHYVLHKLVHLTIELLTFFSEMLSVYLAVFCAQCLKVVQAVGNSFIRLNRLWFSFVLVYMNKNKYILT